jgi:hypothetical protein
MLKPARLAPRAAVSGLASEQPHYCLQHAHNFQVHDAALRTRHAVMDEPISDGRQRQMTDWASVRYAVVDVEGNGQQPPDLVELAVVPIVNGIIGRPTCWLGVARARGPRASPASPPDPASG